MFNLLKGLMNSAPATDFKELVKNGAIIVDVRTPGEFKSGHIKGAINIPLDVLATQTASLAKKGVPVITCCRSGGRSEASGDSVRT